MSKEENPELYLEGNLIALDFGQYLQFFWT